MKHYRLVNVLSGIAIIFGVLTVYSGANALFGSAHAKAAAGNAVLFVLWFNFLGGFAYVLTASGLMLKRQWGVWGAMLLAVLTALVSLAFAVHIFGGAPNEQRTVVAMGIRLGFWSLVAWAVWGYRPLLQQPGGDMLLNK